MKKRIISLLLVVVMLALTLTSCSYSFADESMSTYVNIDAKAFKDALGNLVIEDGSFTTDAETREKLVSEAIYEALGAKADQTNKLYEGTVGAYDFIYYVYCCTADFNTKDELGNAAVDEDVVFFASNMKEASAIKLQLGISSTATALDKAIAEAISGKDIKDYLYKTETSSSTELKLGNVVCIDYTYSYVDASGNEKSVTVTNKKMTLEEGDDLSAKIISECKKIGTSGTFEIGEGTDKVTYKNVKVNWVTISENQLGAFNIAEADFKDLIKDYDKDASKVTDINGASRYLKDAKDGTITYHVYPVSFVKIDDFTATNVLDILYGKNLTKDTLKVFSDETLKATEDGKERTLAELIESLAGLCSGRDTKKTALTSAETALEKAQAAVDKAGDKVTAEQTKALDYAKKALETAEKEYNDKVTELKAKIDLILSIEGVEEKILADYHDVKYDELEDAYDYEIYINAAKALWALVDAVEVKSYPEKALKEMKERILDQHEYTYYTGTNASKVSYYKTYVNNGGFKAYLVDTLAKGKTYDDALAQIEKDAKAALDPIIKIYAVSEIFDCVVSDKQFKDEYIKVNSSYDSSVDTYGELNIRTAYQFNVLFDKVLEFETYEKDEGDNKKGDIKYDEEGKIDFKLIKYSFKTEEESEGTEG